MNNIFKLAKKIRKPGENWQKCIQRARKHFNNQNGGGWGQTYDTFTSNIQNGGGWGQPHEDFNINK